jgi:hypothetical protein
MRTWIVLAISCGLALVAAGCGGTAKKAAITNPSSTTSPPATVTASPVEALIAKTKTTLRKLGFDAQKRLRLSRSGRTM